mgnify:CR=1 FL=1
MGFHFGSSLVVYFITSVVNFKVQMGGSGSGDITINKSSRDSASTDYDARSSSRIILMEIAQ